MKRTILVTLTLLLLCFVSFAQSKRNQPSPSPSPTPQTILLEDSTVIEKMIRNYSKAISDFARSGNVDSITKFYAPGYNEVSDGEERTLSETKQSWEDAGDRINLGSSDRFTISINKIGAIKWFGSGAYVTFTFTQKVGREGQILDTRTGVCTEILTKANESWLIEHEHCSRLELQP